jgi:heme/copper-type cytochrome/quinol oxidase subunit 2
MERKLTLPFASVLSLSFFIFIIVHFFFLWTHFHCGFYDLCVNAPHTSEKRRRRRRTTGVVATVKMLGLDIYVFFLFCFSFGHNKRDGTTQPKQKYNRIWEWKWDV